MYLSRISNSKRQSAKRCTYQYKLNYNDRIVQKPKDEPWAANFGSYVHRIFEEGYTATSYEELDKIATEYRHKWKISSTYHKLLDKCLHNFLKFNASLTETVGVEHEFNLEITDDVIYNGVIDRIVQGRDGGILVIDYKTSSKESTKMDLLKDQQGLGYAYAATKIFNIPINKVIFGHYYPKTDNFVHIQYSNRDIAVFLKKLTEDIWKIRKLKVEDCRPTENELCKWCGYQDFCPVFTNKKLIKENLEKAERYNPKQSKDSKG